MRLKKGKITPNYATTSTKQKIHHNKTSSMDVIPSSKAKHIYLNKILQKNLGIQKVNIDQTNFQKNIPNFQSSIQSILANEETRQKAKNYVLQMRNRQGQNSPSKFPNDFQRNKDINFSNTNYDGFYDIRQRKNYGDMLQENSNYKNNNYIGREMKTEVMLKQKVPYPRINNYISINEHGTPDKIIRVNKLNKYNDEITSYNPSEGNNNIYFKSNLGMNKNHSKGVFNYNNMNNIKKLNNININNNPNLVRNANTNYPLNNNNKRIFYNNKQISDGNQNYYNNKQYNSNNNYNYNNNYINNYNNYIINDENDIEEGYIENFDNNQNEENSASDIINNNNSGLREIVIDNINEIYQSPEVLRRKNDDYENERNSNKN